MGVIIEMYILPLCSQSCQSLLMQKASWQIIVAAEHVYSGELSFDCAPIHCKASLYTFLLYSPNKLYCLSLQRTESQCLLGSSITIERRKPQICCLNGRDYDREFDYHICDCTSEDYEW